MDHQLPPVFSHLSSSSTDSYTASLAPNDPQACRLIRNKKKRKECPQAFPCLKSMYKKEKRKEGCIQEVKKKERKDYLTHHLVSCLHPILAGTGFLTVAVPSTGGEG